MSGPPPLACVAVLVCGLVGGASLGACARPTEVELRLYPCMLTEMGPPPRHVELEIVGYDEAGAAMKPLLKGFDIPDLGVLGDGYATVGLNKPAGMVEAAFTLTWSYGAELTATAKLPRRPVPAAGEVLELGGEGCVPAEGTTSASTGDSSTSGSSSGSTSTGDTSSGTGTGSGSSTGEPSTSTSTGDTSTSSGSESSSGGSSTTGEPTMLGDKCVNEGELFCEHAAPGKLGDALFCEGGFWVVADLMAACNPLNIFCPVDMLDSPVPIGCVNDGVDGFSCACSDQPTVPCEPLDIGCEGNDHITLCTDLGQGDIRVKGLCVGLCKDDGQGPYCLPP